MGSVEALIASGESIPTGYSQVGQRISGLRYKREVTPSSLVLGEGVTYFMRRATSG